MLKKLVIKRGRSAGILAPIPPPGFASDQKLYRLCRYERIKFLH